MEIVIVIHVAVSVWRMTKTTNETDFLNVSPSLERDTWRSQSSLKWKFVACGGFGMSQSELYNRQTD